MRPGSPHSGSARSESQRSSGTGTTATACREALASLRALASQLPPGFAQTPADPAVVAANLRAIGVRTHAPPSPRHGGGSQSLFPLPQPIDVSMVNSASTSCAQAAVLSGATIVPPQSPSGDDRPLDEAEMARRTAHLSAAAAAAAAASASRPATEVRSRPPRGAAAMAAAVQSAEVDVAQILSAFPGLQTNMRV